MEKFKPLTEEEFKDAIKGILRDNREHPLNSINPQCNQCTKRIAGQSPCEAYPKGRPTDIVFNRQECKYFKQK